MIRVLFHHELLMAVPVAAVIYVAAAIDLVMA